MDWRRFVPDGRLLREALTHSSFAHEQGTATPHNERLEFLGDAVVGLVVAEALYQEHPDWDEGRLTQTRAAIVCEATLARAARQLGLGSELALGRGEERTGGREKPSLLADAFEAVAAAAFLAGGIDAARGLVREALAFALENPAEHGAGHDFKTRLAERLRKSGRDPVYRVLEESGPDHQKHFVIGIFVDGVELARGGGRSKKEAEQEAARRAFDRLDAG